MVEVEEGVVAVVADVGLVAGPSPEAAGVEAFTDVLIDLPGDAGVFKKLGISRPVVTGFTIFAAQWQWQTLQPFPTLRRADAGLAAGS